MRTVIAIAVGILLGRELCRVYDKVQLRNAIRQKLLRLLEANGLSKDNAEKQVTEMMDEP